MHSPLGATTHDQGSSGADGLGGLLRRTMLLAVCFFCGAAVLIVEVVATRILAPYFGSTIYTVSSVIGLILAALSLGYYVGGRLADRYATERAFFALILASGLAVFLLYALMLSFLPAYGYTISMIYGPLAATAVLFVAPCFLLGTVSPYVIKLQESRCPHLGIGRISGTVFFWSTVGSISGSLVAGFVLIPAFRVSHIIIFVAVALVLVGLIGVLLSRGKRIVSTACIVSAILGGVIPFLIHEDFGNALYIKDSAYSKIQIFDTKEGASTIRVLMQDVALEANIDAKTGAGTALNDFCSSIHRSLRPNAREALILGGGGYVIPSILIRNEPQMRVDVVELEPRLFDLSRKFFKVPSSSRLKNHVGDGRRFLYEQGKEYDLIISDIFGALSVPFHVLTLEFFQRIRARLSKDGVVVVKYFGEPSNKPRSYLASVMKTFKTAFPNSYFFGWGERDMPQIVVFVGSNGDRILDFRSPRFSSSPDDTIKTAAKTMIDTNKIDFSRQLLLTDDFAPVEYLSAAMLKSSSNVEWDRKPSYLK